MKIRMKQTRRGTEDGHTVQQYFEGEEYEVKDHLGGHFINEGYAEFCEGSYD